MSMILAMRCYANVNAIWNFFKIVRPLSLVFFLYIDLYGLVERRETFLACLPVFFVHLALLHRSSRRGGEGRGGRKRVFEINF